MTTLTATTGAERTTMADRLHSYIADHSARAQAGIARIINEAPTDAIVPAGAMTVGAGEMLFGGEHFTLHPNARAQLADRIEMPQTYAKSLGVAPWGRDVFSYAANRTLAEQAKAGTRYLVRSVGGEVRGLLSDSYRRIDSRPSLDALIGAAGNAGAQIVDAIVTDTRASVRLLLPQILEPVPGEMLVFGLSWQNSDYGHGANAVAAFAMRLACWNGAIRETSVRHVHLGRRLQADIRYAEDTHRLDSQATAAALRDTAQHLLTAGVQETVLSIQRAAAEPIDMEGEVKKLRKVLTVAEHGAASEALRSVDIERLPPGNNRWRLSNAVSWLATKAEQPARELELQEMAGSLLS